MADEFVGELGAGGDFAEDAIDAEGAGEDGAVVGHSPLAEFGSHRFRGIFDEQGGKALRLDVAECERVFPVDQIHALLEPAREVLTHVEKHPDFAEAAVEKPTIELVGTELVIGEQSLEHHAGAGTLYQPAGSVGVGERVQNQRRHLPGRLT